MEKPPPKSDSPTLRVQVLWAGRWVCAAKAKGTSVNARSATDAREMRLSMDFLLRFSVESYGLAEGRCTIPLRLEGRLWRNWRRALGGSFDLRQSGAGGGFGSSEGVTVYLFHGMDERRPAKPTGEAK